MFKNVSVDNVGGKHIVNNFVEFTKKRLLNYTQLQENIRRYKLDIESYKKENFGSSKSIVVFQPRSGEPISVEDRRAVKIFELEKFIERDEYELKELDVALNKVKKDYYYNLVEKYFLQNKKMKVIKDETHLDISNISRQIYRMLEIMSIVLYGADSINESIKRKKIANGSQ